MEQNRVLQSAIEPIVKTMSIPLPVEAAFRLFTEKSGTWWPLKTHSVFGEDAIDCAFEPRAGGRVYEVHKDRQQQSDWGQVRVWEPPHRLVFSFHPGRASDDATEVEVTFVAQGNGSQITLIHRGWERCSDKIQAERGGYDRGWELVLSKFISCSIAVV